MKLPKYYLLLLAEFLLLPLSRWLTHQNDPHFLFGLSSSFWAGVAIGVSIVCGALFVALVVLHVSSARAGEGE